MLQWLRNKLFRRAVTYEQGIAAGLIQGMTYSGLPVNQETALGLSALWCGIRTISEDIGSLPLVLYRVDSNGHGERAKNHPLFPILSSTPNAEQTAPVFWETFVSQAILFGNAFAEIERDGAGRPIALWPIHPLHVRVARNSESGTLVYKVTLSTTGGPPGPAGAERTLDAQDVLHVPGLSPDGSVGYNLLRIARNTIGWGLGAQRYGSAVFRNAGRPCGVIQEQQGQNTSPEAEENMKRSWRQETGGENVGSIAFIRRGYQFIPQDVGNPEQLQYTQLLNFFNSEVGRLLRLSPTKLMDMSRATWGNLTEVNRDHWGSTCRPWAEKIEAECERKLLLPGERNKYEIEFDASTLLRADTATRFTAYSAALNGSPWMTPNEVRAMENMPPVDGGDELPGTTEPEPEPQTDQPDDSQGDDGQPQEEAE